ncbi:reactive intermediate/imine deaminase [Allopseudospirillum japonicum]|uniref:Reactive intermediate/imine deaminase n=1 Tax=Allopseudospirillum japonicum TaxID=64971 RepID=A0A1H6R6L1_9GAMM|nr:RidA family protein [Allopseudospirillum japonicum]SEI47265.1 reactive intermediate/imine deaminase [Allopseudospirillum japonicum]
MSNRAVINTEAAPAAIGTYSQAVKVGNTVYLSGQIPLDPKTMALVSEDFRAQAVQVFTNLQAVCEAAGGSLKDIVKVNLYLTDLANFATVNEVMAEFFTAPYPARAAVQVSALPKAAQFEAEAVMVIGD